MTLSNLLMVRDFTFLAINLKLSSRSVTIRLQVDKGRTFTHTTIIVTLFSAETQRLLHFFEEREIKDRKLKKMFQFKSKVFWGQTRDFLLQNLMLDKWCLWLNGLKNHYGVTGVGWTDKLKNELRRVMIEQWEKGKMLAANKTMIFKHMDHLKILLTEIGKIFLCNIQINEEIVHTDVENFMILGYKVDEKNIKHINLVATMFHLQNTAETPPHLSTNLDLSDSEEEEDEKSVEQPPSFLATNNDAFDLDRVVNSFNDDKNTSSFEIGPEKNDNIKYFLMTNLKKEVPNEEKDFLSQETMKNRRKKNGGKHTS